MASYKFLTTWCLDAPIEAVFEVLDDSAGHPRWWKGVQRVERPYLIEGQATGELEGTGTWRLYGGQGTAVVYDWRVRTTKPWMNIFGPLARPAFAWNHDVVMRQGGEGLAAELGSRLLLHD